MTSLWSARAALTGLTQRAAVAHREIADGIGVDPIGSPRALGPGGWPDTDPEATLGSGQGSGPPGRCRP